MQVQLRQFLLSPLSKVEERDKPLVAKQTLHFSHGGNGVQMMRDAYQGRSASADVGVGLCAADRLRQPGQPDAGAGGEPRSSRLQCARRWARPRMALVRQTLTESIVLAVLGGMAGIVVAFVGTRVILYLAFQQ